MTIAALYRKNIDEQYKNDFEHFFQFSGTQFRWIGTQAEGVRWSMNSLFVGECPEYCHDRGLCTVSGCQCVIGYSGK
jgi:hypothetical protein